MPIVTADLLAALPDGFRLIGVDADGGLVLHVSAADVLRCAPKVGSRR